MTAWKRAVARAFDRADEYEDAAGVQATVAGRLAETIARQPLAPLPRTLEIGCGTGLLTRALQARAELGDMLATDIAPMMLSRCRARIGPSNGVRFVVMDGERPALAPVFDLIASSLAAQWFVNLEEALAGLAALLRPGGLLALTTLADGTFREWRQVQDQSGRTAALPSYPSLEALGCFRAPGCTTEIRLDHVREQHADGTAFLRSLRTIGADTPSDQAAIRSAGALRRALRAFDAHGATVTYVVATCLIRREPSLESVSSLD